MPKRVRRVLGRPKTGQKFYSQSFSLTLEQKEFLRRYPNASELIRKIIDDLIHRQTQLEAGMGSEIEVLSVKYQVDMLEQDANRVHDKLLSHIDYCEKRYFLYNPHLDENGTILDAWKKTRTREPWNPESSEGKFDLQVLFALKKQEDQIRAKISELQETVVS
jgi:Arc/MetJ-type ribon-helix-helix transcriptional regulator